MKNIIVPTDFSEASKNAAKYAVSLAKAFDATVHLINVVIPPVTIDDTILPTVMKLQAEILDGNWKLMDKEISELSKENPRVTGFVEEGGTMEVISKWFYEKNADLVVMGMKGKGNSNSIFGSTTTSLLQKFSFPIFIIPAKAVFKHIGQITFASDFNTSIEMEKYTMMFKIAEQFNSKISILNVQQSEYSMKREELIGKMQTNLAFSKQERQFHTIIESNVEEGINKFILLHPTDILAMVAHKQSFIQRMFGKSFTKSMSYQTEIPLLVLQNK